MKNIAIIIAVSTAHQTTTNLTLFSALSVLPWSKLRAKITLDHPPPGILSAEIVPIKQNLNL